MEFISKLVYNLPVGFAIWSIIYVFVKKINPSNFILELDKIAVVIYQITAAIFIAIFLYRAFSISAADEVYPRYFGEYWWGYWTNYILSFVIILLLIIKKIRLSFLSRLIIALLIIIVHSASFITEIVNYFHRDFLPSSWSFNIWPHAKTMLLSLFYFSFILSITYLVKLGVNRFKT